MSLDSYRSAAGHAVGMTIASYGYTLTIWTSGSVLTHARGLPSTSMATRKRLPQCIFSSCS